MTYSAITTIPRGMIHAINPIISEVKSEDTFTSIARLIRDIGSIMREITGTGMAVPYFHLLYDTISAALEYEQSILMYKKAE